jgi:levansucrase
LAHENGATVVHNGRQYWFFLCAPCLPDPGHRHFIARIRLASLGSDGWRDHGNALPDGMNPGSREWAGSAVLHDNGTSVTLFYTVAGRPGLQQSVEQRIFSVAGTLGIDGPGLWQTPTEAFTADGTRYILAQAASGKPGMIKGFRDPAWLRDPSTGARHLLFTGSAAWSDDDFNGVIGMATLVDGQWLLQDPLIEAVAVNNELERPHIILRGGLYYLFWSTQRHTFSPKGQAGPNGLYAMVAEQISGPWLPVNEGGLVAGNPSSEPTQTYSWWVTGEGAVWSFIDQWGMEGRKLADHPELLRAQFGGTPSPVFQLAFDGKRVTIAA